MIFLLLFLLLVFTSPLVAEAYIDPGTGSFIIQVAVASLAGAALYAKFFWRKAKGFLGSFPQKDKKDKKGVEGEPIKSDEQDKQHLQ